MNLKNATLLAIIGISLNAIIRIFIFIASVADLDLSLNMYYVIEIFGLLSYATIVLFFYVLWKNQSDSKEEN